MIYALKAEESLSASDCDDSRGSEEPPDGVPYPNVVATKVVQIITGLLSAPPSISEVSTPPPKAILYAIVGRSSHFEGAVTDGDSPAMP